MIRPTRTAHEELEESRRRAAESAAVRREADVAFSELRTELEANHFAEMITQIIRGG